MVTDQHRTTDELIEDDTLSGRVRERRPEQKISAEDEKRRRERAEKDSAGFVDSTENK